MSVMSAPVVNTAITSWWYGQGRAVDVARRLETLHALTPAPGPVGAVTVSRGHLSVAFQKPLASPLPTPWQPAGGEARLDWGDVDSGSPPDPDHPVYLVALGVQDDSDALVVLNLGAFSRIRIGGDPDVARRLVTRWVFELIATHPATTVGITDDIWPGPTTHWVRTVSAGTVPDVDVLICGPDVSYADRAQIVTSASSRILIDLGADAAVTTTWVVNCGADHRGELSNGRSTISATLIIPSGDVIDMCRELLTKPPSAPAAALPDPAPVNDVDHADHGYDQDDEDPIGADEAFADDGPPPQWSALSSMSPAPPLTDDPLIDPRPHEPPGVFPEPGLVEEPNTVTAEAVDDAVIDTDGAADIDDCSPPGPGDVDAQPSAAPTADLPAEQPRAPTPGTPVAGSSPRVAVIWNRILGPVTLCPPHGTAEHPREVRLRELTVYLQDQGPVSAEDIKKDVCRGSSQTVTGQLSILRTRLGPIRADGPSAFPHADREGFYHLLKEVRSDWMEFDRLVDLIPARSETEHLVAAMELVTGPPLGGVGDNAWIWASSLRDQLRSRVPDAAAELAQRFYQARNHSAALEVASKGLWYDPLRQDLLAVALRSAGDSGNHVRFRELRAHYLAKVPAADRDPVVHELIGRAE